MSNAKYFLLGVGMPESRGPSKPSADLPWETKTWNWLCLTLRMASQHLNSHNEEAQRSWALVLHPVQMLQGWGHADQPRVAEAPLSLPSDGPNLTKWNLPHTDKHKSNSALQLNPNTQHWEHSLAKDRTVRVQDHPAQGSAPPAFQGPWALPPPDEET